MYQSITLYPINVYSCGSVPKKRINKKRGGGGRTGRETGRKDTITKSESWEQDCSPPPCPRIPMHPEGKSRALLPFVSCVISAKLQTYRASITLSVDTHNPVHPGLSRGLHEIWNIQHQARGRCSTKETLSFCPSANTQQALWVPGPMLGPGDTREAGNSQHLRLLTAGVSLLASVKQNTWWQVRRSLTLEAGVIIR